MLGEVKYNRYGTPMKIIRYGSRTDIDIMFMDEHNYIVKHAIYQNFKKGVMKNPYDKSVYRTGYLGVGKYLTKENGRSTQAYSAWHDMIGRCYDSTRSEKYDAYYGKATVCSEWHCFHTFADWYEEHKYNVDERLHVDKDILYPGNKVYAPDRCLVIPQRISMLFTNKSNNRGLPNGIIQVENGYLAQYNHDELGVYSTVEEAYARYAKEKEKYIKVLADEYKDIIPEQVYEALYSYELDIRNDKNYVVA